MKIFKLVVELKSYSEIKFLAFRLQDGEINFIRYGSHRSEYDNNFFDSKEKFLTSLVRSIKNEKLKENPLEEVRYEVIENGELKVVDLTELFNSSDVITSKFVSKYIH